MKSPDWLEPLLTNLLANLVWYILGLVAAVLLAIRGKLARVFRTATHVSSAGVSRIIFSRNQYGERLPRYLEYAQQSIRIVSISLKLTNDEGKLTDLFRRKLASPTFEITISLLRPSSAAVALAASALDVSCIELEQEIATMLGELTKLREHLAPTDRSRLLLCTHDCLPMGSAIMIDATPMSGRIQVETKLYRTPRISSFGYEVVGPSEFFTHNYEAWSNVIRDSTPYV